MGFGAPVSGSWATAANMVRVARRAEELGYAGLWTFQRVLSPVDGHWGETYRSVHDPVATMGFLAGVTSRIRLGVAVLNVPFYPPALLSKALTTLDVVSGGRLDVGLGLGWAPEEYAATGASMQRRGARIEEFVAVLGKIWAEDVVEHDGEFFTIPTSRFDPKPVQRPRPPILLGGTAEPALRRVGRIADGWVSSSRADLTAIGTSIGVVRAAAEQADRDPDALRYVCRGAVRLRATAEDRPLVGPVEKIRDDIGRLGEQGVTDFFVDLNFDPEVGSPDADPAASMDRAERLLTALAPSPS